MQSLYVEREGAWWLDAEGVVEKAKADEMRAHNIQLRKQIEELTARYEGINPDEVKRLADEKLKLEEQQQLKAGELDKVIQSRVNGIKADYDKQIQALTGERDSLTTRLAAIQIDQGVISEASQRGLRPTAVADITARARQTFKLVNGVPQAFEPDGITVRHGKDGVTPMTFTEWVDAQTSDAPHLFESKLGGGAASNPTGGGTGSGRSVKNPFRKESWNVTEQMKLQKTDPQLAARLKAGT